MNLVTTSPLSIVIPVFNEVDNIALLTKKIHESLEGYNYQIIYVDDFSFDGTRKAIKNMKDDRVHLISLKRNYGQSLALAAGIDYAQGDYIITMDGDLQNDPSDIPKMLKYITEKDYDVVTGIREERKDSFVKKIPSKIANSLIRRTAKLDIKDNGCALKIFTKEIAKDLNLYGEMHRFITLLAHFEGARIKQVPVKHHARHAGSSKYGLERVFKVVADIMLLLFIRKYFQRPIHFFGIFGFVLILIGIAINMYLLIVKFGFGEDIGTRPLLTFGMMFILAGIQLFTIGIVMELLIRTYYESQKKRPYRIKSITIADQVQP
ncbi:glycosyltransferase family 2 protein [Zobellia galactanivorans]|uniref:Undecaprenyl-phosphate 4-deoxy-4-formamido-L-arabinose transferase, family GT2 n=1 Tax=Zobellia galactanivorans (strain DSM 12802 / CCUG 47099 / CIP 106680 / NCIMB 13871 / Dsij) TaxID=63186 RepID=G0KZM9_ZOBGA|nr:glycosyltransferase family 2 protein [Zobellia galactanivorans]MBU3025153.1 glycosyltransferase family 2 protein [Zobellia galactanivorans]MDO6810572.1 glycosyltransferase family 2 protein [Zobellia galactanivorans]CAZ97074.1 Undecaprenyl-phosphate 4-deoxy-4-formamido-L-arabinose transferase, family GT2 [Zobellia galactanivorans]